MNSVRHSGQPPFAFAFRPDLHALPSAALDHEVKLHGGFAADPRPGAHVVRAAQTGVWTAEPGHMCPISMTYAVIPALRYNQELSADHRAAR